MRAIQLVRVRIARLQQLRWWYLIAWVYCFAVLSVVHLIGHGQITLREGMWLATLGAILVYCAVGFAVLYKWVRRDHAGGSYQWSLGPVTRGLVSIGWVAVLLAVGGATKASGLVIVTAIVATFWPVVWGIDHYFSRRRKTQ